MLWLKIYLSIIFVVCTVQRIDKWMRASYLEIFENADYYVNFYFSWKNREYLKMMATEKEKLII